jgi:hypothetical protein
MQENNKRKFTRINLDLAVRYRRCDVKETGNLERVNTVNISPGGFCIRTGGSLGMNDIIQLNLPGLSGANEEFLARVVYNQQHLPSGESLSGLAVLPQYQEKLSDYIESLDSGNALSLFLSPDDREFLENLAGGQPGIRACVTGISRFFQGLGLKAAGNIASEEDLVKYLSNELKKRE